MRTSGAWSKAMGVAGATNCKVLEGSSDGALAILQVQATVFGSLSSAQVYMAKEGATWTIKKQDSWKDVK
jgi:hypothetical protein